MMVDEIPRNEVYDKHTCLMEKLIDMIMSKLMIGKVKHIAGHMIWYDDRACHTSPEKSIIQCKFQGSYQGNSCLSIKPIHQTGVLVLEILII